MKVFLDFNDREFLDRLHRLRAATVQELCDDLGVTATAVRQRLTRLLGLNRYRESWHRRIDFASLWVKREWQDDCRQDLRHYVDRAIDLGYPRSVPWIVLRHWLPMLASSLGSRIWNVVRWALPAAWLTDVAQKIKGE